MSQELLPVAPKDALCKCCGAAAPLYGVVDFHKNCEIIRRKVLDVSGVPVYYHRCPQCRFIFTTAFDHFTTDDFRRHIYNDQYVQVDPDYREVRPKACARMLNQLFASSKPKRFLDYGGGNGTLAALLRDAGFEADTYDPFVPEHSVKPTRQYDCIVCFEVFEHTTDPKRTLGEVCDLLEDPGLIIFSTLVQPANMDQQGLNWWYAGPRNGHVSLHSTMSLALLGKQFGFSLGSKSENLHVLARNVPPFAKHFIRAA